MCVCVCVCVCVCLRQGCAHVYEESQIHTFGHNVYCQAYITEKFR